MFFKLCGVLGNGFSDRLAVLHELFDEEPFAGLPRGEAPEASRKSIALAHPETYIESIEKAIPENGYASIDGDTTVCPASWEAALRAAGAVCQAVGDIAAGKTVRAFCATRPPGHHAEPSQAMGFCLFNNIFIGALHAQENYGFKNIAIVDFDVHHGNGTEAMARFHDRVFYASSHQWPLFPGTGLPENNIPGKIVNVPLAEGDGSAEFRAAWQEKIFPELKKFRPDLLMISAGFDAHRDDPLAGLNLTEEDFAWITEELRKIADEYCGGKIVSVLEGGYHLEALKNSVSAHLKALAA